VSTTEVNGEPAGQVLESQRRDGDDLGFQLGKSRHQKGEILGVWQQGQVEVAATGGRPDVSGS
jgi:hypothetical protein